MTKLNLDELQRLDAAATPAPWYPQHEDDALCMNAYYVSTKPDGHNLDTRNPSDDVIAICLLQEPRLAGTLDGKWDANTALIAAMRNALPALIARLRAADELRAALSGALSWKAANPRADMPTSAAWSAVLDALAAYDALEVME